MKHILLLTALFLYLPSIWAQSEAKATAETQAVRKIIDMLFVGMKMGDSSIVRSVFYPDARLSTSFLNKAKAPVVHIDKIDDFLGAVGTPHKEVWDERIQDVVIHVDGTMAQVWAPYHFYLDGEFLHCGVNAFQLVLTADGWKILNLTDTRRTEGCN